MEQLRNRTFVVLALLWIATVAPLWGQVRRDWPNEVRTLAAEKQLDRAMATVEEWMRAYPEDLDARAWRARLWVWQGLRSEAESEYRALLAKAPDDPDLLLELARLLSYRKEYEQAVALLDRAMAQSPERADCRLEMARTLARSEHTREARALYRQLAAVDGVSDVARAALTELSDSAKHRLVVGAAADWLSYAQDGSTFAASLGSRWSRGWSTTAGVTRWGRFGKSATGVEADATFRPSGSDAVTVGGGSAPGSGIAPRAQFNAGYDHGVRIAEAGLVRGLELTYEQKWLWYPGVKIVNFAPAAVLHLAKGWSWVVGGSAARMVTQDGGPSWSPGGQTRLVIPLNGRVTAQAQCAIGVENFGTVDRILFRHNRMAGGGLRVRVAHGGEVGMLAAYERIEGGRMRTSLGAWYAIRF